MRRWWWHSGRHNRRACMRGVWRFLWRRWTWLHADTRECVQDDRKQTKRVKQGAKRGFNRVVHAGVETEQDAAQI
eukprot:2074154-Pleurochrysis_carterae.AAC.1